MHLLKISILLSLIFLSSCGPQPIKEKIVTTAGAAANPNAPAKWDASSFPLPIKVSTSFDATEDTQIRAMAAKWETAGNNEQDFFTLNDNSATTTNKEYSSLNSYYDSEMGIYKSTSWFSDVSSYALAITQFWGYRRNVGSSNEFIQLTHADIIMNYNNYDFALDDFSGDNYFKYDLASVVLHEMGHFLGLYHDSSSTDTVMKSTINSGTEKRTPFSADETAIQQKYGLNGYSSGLMANTQKLSGSFSTDKVKSEQEGEFVGGRIELRSTGTCHHIINGKQVHSHKLNSKKLKKFIQTLKKRKI